MSSILKPRDKEFVKKKFDAELKSNVRLVFFTQEFECEYCEITRKILEELAQLGGVLKLEVYDLERDKEVAERWRVDKIPATLLLGEKERWVRFFGVPSGYEFATLIEDIVDVSRGQSRLSSRALEMVKSVDRPLHIQVFVTPTCPYCPRAVRIAHQMAIENPNIVADMVEVIEFPHLAQKYQVMAVPKTVVNDVIHFEGALPELHYIEHVLHALH
ncbi:MAG: thioredoxin family protein [Nitrososphaerota archaeon]|nr:thioredoxin family protein [Candidatus Calditenuaceae archaeon]MDW8072868.1 thioredoxin family protein [Nitrososphaerota archaeon]